MAIQSTPVLAVLLMLTTCLLDTNAWDQPRKFLLVSNARNASIGYVKIPELGFDGTTLPYVNNLLDHGLIHPQGLAVDQRNNRLYIADPNLNKLVAYSISSDGDKLRLDPTPVTVAEDVETRWVAVDGLGNVWFTDEGHNQILKISAEQIATAQTLSQVRFQTSAPGGIAVDNFYVYWTNKLSGETSGVVHRGEEGIGGANVENTLQTLASNVDKAYGLCLAVGNAFYTTDSKVLYGVMKNGGSSVSTISSNFTNPRGCVWDGDGTVYVADRGRNAVYGIAAPMVNLQETAIVQAFNYEDAFGLALYSAASRHLVSFSLLLIGMESVSWVFSQ